jgi:hypothetical protein
MALARAALSPDTLVTLLQVAPVSCGKLQE